jgi:hypothetical protein
MKLHALLLNLLSPSVSSAILLHLHRLSLLFILLLTQSYNENRVQEEREIKLRIPLSQILTQTTDRSWLCSGGGCFTCSNRQLPLLPK